MFNFITSKFFDFNVFINYIEDKNMTTLSAINQKYIENKSKAKNTNSAQNTFVAPIKIEQPKDKVELSKKSGFLDKLKNNKKLTLGLIAGIVAAAIVSAYLIIKKPGSKNTQEIDKILEKGKEIFNEGSQIIEETDKIKRKGADIIEEGKKEFDEVLSLITQGRKNNYNMVYKDNKINRYFQRKSDGMVMVELDDARQILRETFFSETLYQDNNDFAINIEKILKHTQENSAKPKIKSFSFENGILTMFKEAEADSLGAISHIFEFDYNGDILRYLKNGKETQNNRIFDEIYTFFNNELSLFSKNSQEDKINNTNSVERLYSFNDKKLKSYAQNYTITRNNNGQSLFVYNFEDDGSIKEYIENIIKQNNTTKCQKRYGRINNKFEEIKTE